MNRYRYQQVKFDKETGHRKLSTTEYAKIDSKNSDIVYTTKYRDSYSSLAQRFYHALFYPIALLVMTVPQSSSLQV